jgi:predicted hydrolase (HD superfamily)
VAGALVKKEKSLAAIDVPFLVKRMKEKSFARGANRDQIRTCTELGLSIEEFLGLSLEAMQGISAELGL